LSEYLGFPITVIIPYVNHVSVKCFCHRYNILYVPKALVNNNNNDNNNNNNNNKPDSMTVVNTEFLRIVKLNIIDLSIIWGNTVT